MKMFYKAEKFCDTPVALELSDVELNTAIEKTRQALANAYTGFDHATDADLIDSYIYEINALQKRYKYLTELSQPTTETVQTASGKHSPIRALVSHVFG